MIGDVAPKLGNTRSVVEAVSRVEFQGSVGEKERELAEIVGQELELHNLTVQVASELLAHLLRFVALDHGWIHA